MSAVDIANAAGVTSAYVGKLLQQGKTDTSIKQLNSETTSKVKTSRGMRPRTYRTRKKRKPKPNPPSLRPSRSSGRRARKLPTTALEHIPKHMREMRVDGR
jgi:hypothetical protein